MSTRKSSRFRNEITVSELRSTFSYDAATGIFIRIFSKRSDYRGSNTGFLDKDGYIRISFRKKLYKSHRLAWLYVYGTWPKGDIDHINGVRDDNRILNLRETTNSLNIANSRLSIRNKSGRKGASWASREGKWRAQIKVGGKVKSLGYFDDLDSAAAAYAKSAILYFGQFARIT